MTSGVERMKVDLLRGLIRKNVNLSDQELAELTGFKVGKVENIRESQARSTLDDEKTPLSWDYVLAFNVGDEDKLITPTRLDRKLRSKRGDTDNEKIWEDGMPENKFFGQIVNDIWKRLIKSHLAVQAYKSADEKSIYFLIGISEHDLKMWGDIRDTDLLCDKYGAIKYGRERGFPLAKRTIFKGESGGGGADDNDYEVKVEDDGSGAPQEQTIALEHWDNIYMEYNRYVPQEIYTHYERIPGDNNLMTPFSEKIRLRIIYESMIADSNEGGTELAFAELLKTKRHPLKAAFPLHDQRMLDHFDDIWIREFNPLKVTTCPLQEIRDYFGEPVGFYFAFLQFYLVWLKWPSVVGFIFFMEQLIIGDIAAPGIYLMCLFVITWCVAFVDFWYREEARLRLRWGMTKFEDKAIARPEFDGDWVHDEVTGMWTETFSIFARLFRQGTILAGIVLFLGACVASVISILLFRDDNPNDFQLKIGLGVANGAMISLFDMLYQYFSKYGNNWENYRTEQDYQNALIQKSFFFKFFNSFASLFYLGFFRPWIKGNEYYIKNYNDVCNDNETYMETFVKYYEEGGDWDGCNTEDCAKTNDKCDADCYGVAMTGYTVNQTVGGVAVANGDPCGGSTINSDLFCKVYCDEEDVVSEVNAAVLDELRVQLASLFVTAIVIQNAVEVLLPFIIGKIKEMKRVHDAEKNGEELLELTEAEVQAELEPYANTIEDMSELVIQFGYVTLFVLALPITPLLAWINNVVEMKVDAINMVKTSQRPHPDGSYGLGSWNGMIQFFSIVSVGTNVGLITWRTTLVYDIFGDTSVDWVFFSVLSIALSLVVTAEKALIPDVPLAVEEAIERQTLVESVLVLGASVDNFNDNPPAKEGAASFSFDPNAEPLSVKILHPLPMDGLQYGGSVVVGGAGSLPIESTIG